MLTLGVNGTLLCAGWAAPAAMWPGCAGPPGLHCGCGCGFFGSSPTIDFMNESTSTLRPPIAVNSFNRFCWSWNCFSLIAFSIRFLCSSIIFCCCAINFLTNKTYCVWDLKTFLPPASEGRGKVMLSQVPVCLFTGKGSIYLPTDWGGGTYFPADRRVAPPPIQGRYPLSRVGTLPFKVGTPPGGGGRQSSTASTCYVVGSMPLASCRRTFL